MTSRVVNNALFRESKRCRHTHTFFVGSMMMYIYIRVYKENDHELGASMTDWRRHSLPYIPSSTGYSARKTVGAAPRQVEHIRFLKEEKTDELPVVNISIQTISYNICMYIHFNLYIYICIYISPSTLFNNMILDCYTVCIYILPLWLW